MLPPEPYDELYAGDVSLPDFDESELADRPSPLGRWHEMRGVDRLSDDELLRLRQHYFGLVTFIDEQLGRLFDWLAQRGLDENLLTVFTSDHGSSLGDHGQLTKGPYDSADITRVPLVFHWPERIARGYEYEDLSQIVDLLPTLVDLLGATPRDRYEGTSLTPVLSGESPRLHDSVFIEGTFPSVHSGIRETVRTLDWRYTRYRDLEEHELVDLQSDPEETRDVSDDHPERVASFREDIERWRAETQPVDEIR